MDGIKIGEEDVTRTFGCISNGVYSLLCDAIALDRRRGMTRCLVENTMMMRWFAFLSVFLIVA